MIEDFFDKVVLDAIEKIERRRADAVTVEATEAKEPIDYSRVHKLETPKRMPNLNDLVYSGLQNVLSGVFK